MTRELRAREQSIGIGSALRKGKSVAGGVLQKMRLGTQGGGGNILISKNRGNAKMIGRSTTHG